MQAATIRDREVAVEEHPDPAPGVGEVLVRVRAAGVNGADMMQRRGLYPAPPGSPPDIPGLELAGEVAALGPGAERFAPGERVMAIVGGGGQAELCVVHERQLMPVPNPLDWPASGALPELLAQAGRPDVLVVDPPRAGLSKSVVRRIIDAAPRRIVYVSCNPTTLAPNAAELVHAGWTLQRVRPVDMFPQTHHIECVALLERAR